MIADKSRRKWGKIVLARLTFRSLGRRIDYESATSKSRFHHDLRVSFSQKRMLKRKTKGKQSKKRSHEKWKNGSSEKKSVRVVCVVSMLPDEEGKQQEQQVQRIITLSISHA